MDSNYNRGLNEVLSQIKADRAWHYSTGEGTTIAIVDTGICGDMKEFPLEKRSQYCWPSYQKAWLDPGNHGSMVASIAAASNQTGGRFNGVAPNSLILSCQTDFTPDNLCSIYEYLISLVENGKIQRLVINNSYGLRSSIEPDVDLNTPFPSIVREAVNKGIVVVFPAGNNHVARCGNDPLQCGPNSIWGVNSFDEVICVGTIDENGRMDQLPNNEHGYSHCDSSRGPGQFSRNTIKPDCVAPTYGEVVWGNRYVNQEWWGTSGAAAQVSGLAALILTINPSFTPQDVQYIIKKTCSQLPLPQSSVGAGLIDCEAALLLATNISSQSLISNDLELILSDLSSSSTNLLQ